MTAEQTRAVWRILLVLRPTEVHHGDCIGGDTQVHDLAKAAGARRVVHPPVSDRYRAFCNGEEVREPAPYLERDHNIVDETDLLLAAPKQYEEIRRSGTWATWRYANPDRRIVVYPDGRTDPPEFSTQE
jgi:hypothetical protein